MSEVLATTLKLPPGASLGFGATVDEVADAIQDQLPEEEREQITRGELEVKAIELISNPHAAAAFLDHARDPGTPNEADDAETPVVLPKPKKLPATIYVHLSDLVLGGVADGIARVEGIGPMLLEQLTELLQNREIALQPVIDLNETHAVNGYEHPALVKHRTLLRMLGDAFPHSANIGYRRLDHDHPTPYLPPDRGGPPGPDRRPQRRPADPHSPPGQDPRPRLQPLPARAGRLPLDDPHDLARVVTPSGTRRVDLLRDPSGHVIGETYPGPRIEYHPRN